MIKTFTLASLQAYLAMAEKESTIAPRNESAMDQIKDQVEDQVRDISKTVEEGSSEIERELERAWERAGDDFECWWSDRNNGDGKCRRRARDAEEDACWEKMDGSEWDWDSNACLSPEESLKKREKDCSKDGGEWKTDEWSSWCVTPRDLCWEQGSGEWDWENNRCLSLEEAEVACLKRDGENTWDLENKRCKSAEEIAADLCWGKQDGSEWDWNSNVCLSAEESLKKRKEECDKEGGEWKTDEWSSWCEWDWSKKDIMKMKMDARKAHDSRNLAKVAGSISGQKVEEIYSEVIAGQREAEDLSKNMIDELVPQIEETASIWGDKWSTFAKEQSQREEKAFNEMAGYIFDSVTVDGVTLTEMFGKSSDLMDDIHFQMMNKQTTARSLVKHVTMQKLDDNVEFSFTTPSEDAINKWMIGMQQRADNITQSLESMVSEYLPKYDNLTSEVGDILDTIGEDQVGAMLNITGDLVKSVTDSLDVSDLSLAQADAQTESNHSNAYTGAAFGVVGLAATFVLISTCHKKEVSEGQSSLLDGYQSANLL